VFNLPSGDLGVVVGDVSGHGLRAAVVMGRLCSALRAYALDEDEPATVLARLDRKITHFEAGNLATIVYAMINPARDQMIVSMAGHLPPLLAMPDQEPRTLNLPVDLAVGVGAATTRRSSVIHSPRTPRSSSTQTASSSGVPKSSMKAFVAVRRGGARLR
jgi:sigma-B regulation protein RsbU (phosphoserine phosphatase)